MTPIVLVGNKCDREADRVVETGELRVLADDIPGCTCGCVEASAKKNLNVEEIFLKLFVLAKLPTEMSPSLHRKVTPNYVRGLTPSGSGSGAEGGKGGLAARRGISIRRRLSDACGAVAPNVRRPSIRTDLLLLQTRQGVSDSDSELSCRRADNNKCSIQ